LIYVQSDHPPGAVGFVGGEIARYHTFTVCFTGLNVPPGTRIFTGIGYDAAYNRNAVIEKAFFGCKSCFHPHKGSACPSCDCVEWVDQGLQWVQLWDDDHVFAPDTLLRLLDSGENLVCPLYTQRQPPFRPCVYKRRVEDEKGGWEIYSWEDFEGYSGLAPVAAAGAGGMLIRRPIIEALGDKNWFEHENNVGEDMTFFKKCIDAGFVPYVDLRVQIGHMTPIEVWPNVNPELQWGAKVNLFGNPQQTVEYWPAKYRAEHRSGS